MPFLPGFFSKIVCGTEPTFLTWQQMCRCSFSQSAARCIVWWHKPWVEPYCVVLCCCFEMWWCMFKWFQRTMSGQRVPKASGLDMRSPVKWPSQFLCSVRGWKTSDTLKGHFHTPVNYQTNTSVEKTGERQGEALSWPLRTRWFLGFIWGKGLQMDQERFAYLCRVSTLPSLWQDTVIKTSYRRESLFGLTVPEDQSPSW